SIQKTQEKAHNDKKEGQQVGEVNKKQSLDNVLEGKKEDRNYSNLKALFNLTSGDIYGINLNSLLNGGKGDQQFKLLREEFLRKLANSASLNPYGLSLYASLSLVENINDFNTILSYIFDDVINSYLKDNKNKNYLISMLAKNPFGYLILNDTKNNIKINDKEFDSLMNISYVIYQAYIAINQGKISNDTYLDLAYKLIDAVSLKNASELKAKLKEIAEKETINPNAILNIMKVSTLAIDNYSDTMKKYSNEIINTVLSNNQYKVVVAALGNLRPEELSKE
ncbi:MAG: hypothetical protein QXX36_04045, partial [Candidatus Rehaiarchaeum fermentans]|nr:hypothetical protein [Candidatus Rehaiarchaeum fermentans]MCW1302770.1 hypothetical protein [Candidatus Rehaiarchaeum fermentans]